MSSAVVSLRTKMSCTLGSALTMASATSGEKTTLPVAAPGEAGKPFPNTVFSALVSTVGCKK